LSNHPAVVALREDMRRGPGAGVRGHAGTRDESEDKATCMVE
jgi:hypothetical protein